MPRGPEHATARQPAPEVPDYSRPEEDIVGVGRSAANDDPYGDGYQVEAVENIDINTVPEPAEPSSQPLPRPEAAVGERIEHTAAELADRVAAINRDVQTGDMAITPANLEVDRLEREIRALEAAETLPKLRTEAAAIQEAADKGEISAEEAAAKLEKNARQTKKAEGFEDAYTGKSPETKEREAAEAAAKEEQAETRAEYLRLKHEHKAAEAAFYDAIKEDYATRDHISRLFGLGRGVDSMSPSVREAYDTYLEANQAYFKYAQESGQYQKIAERLNRDLPPGQEAQINLGLANRHYLRAAEKRLVLQTESFVPKPVANALEGMKRWIGASKKRQIGAVLVGVAINAPGMIAGFIANKAQTKRANTFAQQKEGQATKTVEEVLGQAEIDLNDFENIFIATEKAQREETKVGVYRTGAAVATGATLPGFGLTTFLTGNAEAAAAADVSIDAQAGVEAADSVTAAEVSASEAPVTPDTPAAPEATHTIVRGDNLFSIVHDELAKRVAAGTYELPPGVTADSLMQYIYQAFPEMTDATDVSARLTPAEWQELIGSDNPHLITPGETVQVEALLEKMSEARVEGAGDTTVDAATAATEQPAAVTESTQPEMLSTPSQITESTEPATGGKVPHPPESDGAGLSDDEYDFWWRDDQAADVPTAKPSLAEAIQTGQEALTEVTADEDGRLWFSVGEEKYLLRPDAGPQEFTGSYGQGIVVDYQDGQVMVEKTYTAADGGQVTVKESWYTGDGRVGGGISYTLEPGGLEGLENSAASAARTEQVLADFQPMVEQVGATHQFVPGEKMGSHLLHLLDEMSLELKQQYLSDLLQSTSDGGYIIERNHYMYLVEKLPEAMGLPIQFGSDGLTQAEWQYAGVPSGDPLDLRGAVLDHAKFFEVLFSNQSERVQSLTFVEPDPAVLAAAAEAAVEAGVTLNDAQVVPAAEIVSERAPVDEFLSKFDGQYPTGEPLEATLYDRNHGFQPMITEALTEKVYTVPEGMDIKAFAEVLDAEVFAAYQTHNINLPAGTMYHLEYSPQGFNPAAIGYFVDKYAAELAGGRDWSNLSQNELGLSATQWRDLGFSSGNPQQLVAGDTIQTGKIIELILERAAKDINTS